MRRRTRWILTLTILGACDESLAPATRLREPRAYLSTDAASGSHTAPTQLGNAYYESTIGTYSTPTIIELTISGHLTISSYNHSTASFDLWSESGYRGTAIGWANCHAPIAVAWGGRWHGDEHGCGVSGQTDDYVTTALVSGTGRVQRSSLYNDTGTSCDGGPCMRHQGAHTVSWTRVPAELTVTPSSTSVLPGQSVSFTAAANPPSISGIPTPLTNIAWHFQPDSGAGGQVCGATVNCVFPPQRTGLLTCNALVNGVQKSRKASVSVLPCLTGDSLLDDARIRKLLNDAWNGSSPNDTNWNRRERIGARIQLPDGSVVDTLYALGAAATPCAADPFGGNMGGIPLVGIHTHPFSPNNPADPLPYDPTQSPVSNCQQVVDAVNKNGLLPPGKVFTAAPNPSPKDLQLSGGIPNIIVDADNVWIYYPGPWGSPGTTKRFYRNKPGQCQALSL